MAKKPLFISKEGGTIHQLQCGSSKIFRVCSDHLSLYCDDLVSAKVQLKRLEELRLHSYCLNMEKMKHKGESLRKLVESSAAPYLESTE